MKYYWATFCEKCGSPVFKSKMRCIEGSVMSSSIVKGLKNNANDIEDGQLILCKCGSNDMVSIKLNWRTWRDLK